MRQKEHTVRRFLQRENYTNVRDDDCTSRVRNDRYLRLYYLMDRAVFSYEVETYRFFSRTISYRNYNNNNNNFFVTLFCKAWSCAAHRKKILYKMIFIISYVALSVFPIVFVQFHDGW